MQRFAPVYGFHINKPTIFKGYMQISRSTVHQQVTEWSRDNSSFHLSSILLGANLDGDSLFEIEAADLDRHPARAALNMPKRLDVGCGASQPRRVRA